MFETRFGKVGLMVCYDGFFPEVARELANRGAEVIAWPVWGCNPLLARARAVLAGEFPETAARIQLHVPDEKSRRVGQAVAAASLPERQRT